MHFSKTTEYAIRVLVYLHQYNTSPHSVKELHKELSLPYKYLTLVMTHLVKQGLVSSSRGRNGGIALAKSGEEILLGDILRALGEPMEYNRCILGFEKCDRLNPCALHSQWVKPKVNIEQMLSKSLSTISGS